MRYILLRLGLYDPFSINRIGQRVRHVTLRKQSFLSLLLVLFLFDTYMYMCTLVWACGLKAVNKESESVNSRTELTH